MTLGDKPMTPEQADKVLEEARQVKAQRQREHMEAFQAEFQALLQKYKLRMMPQCVIQGGAIVEHNVAFVSTEAQG